MDCEIQNREKLIDDYIRGVISTNDKHRLEEHVFICDECFRDLLIREETYHLIKTEGKELFADYLRSVQSKEKRFQLSDLLNFQPPRVRWQPALGLAAVVLIAVFIGVYSIFFSHSEHPILLNYDHRVPHEYSEITLRGGSEQVDQSLVFHSFVNGFRLGISDYNVFEYQSAVQIFEKLQPLADQLEQTDNSQYLPWIRDFYFYQGVAHLALSLSSEFDLDQTGKNIHRSSAIGCLEKAKSIADAHQMSQLERELFYLAQAVGSSGQIERAVEILNGIQPQSDFYSESQLLIRLWKK
ncbi:MAG: zf-HC2 domain-containing protein [bacterium]|nr:zf-HC2 domain-containing protein [bacterium]